MDFDYSPRQKELMRRVSDFMEEHVYPAQPIYDAQQREGDRWKVIPIVEELKKKARGAGLWNMFMPPHSGMPHVDNDFKFEGVQLTNLEYAPIAEFQDQGLALRRIVDCRGEGTDARFLIGKREPSFALVRRD